MIGKAFLSLIGFMMAAIGFSFSISSKWSKEELNEIRITAAGGFKLFAAGGLLYWSILEKTVPEKQTALLFHLSFLLIGLAGFALSVFIWFG
ncbi:hypothetical protein [Bacillus sp. SJS]|uniref:hypothetical protein n=1 Tax=Bacillus sp. SJS TaxID=1423321 RepID=UPI0004DD3B6F|nr:hypothetical protein [Bacillus sp. SJS]KZZ82912.1 hypothetical protein AS29_019135 [Bacillus sp. SJS]